MYRCTCNTRSIPCTGICRSRDRNYGALITDWLLGGREQVTQARRSATAAEHLMTADQSVVFRKFEVQLIFRTFGFLACILALTLHGHGMGGCLIRVSVSGTRYASYNVLSHPDETVTRRLGPAASGAASAALVFSNLMTVIRLLKMSHNSARGLAVQGTRNVPDNFIMKRPHRVQCELGRPTWKNDMKVSARKKLRPNFVENILHVKAILD